jgi:hypothetical protein
MKTRFPKNTPRKLRRQYSRWKSRHYGDWLFAHLVLASLGKTLP